MSHRGLRMENSILCFQSSYIQAQCHFKVIGYTLKIAMRETTQNQTMAIDVSVLFQCILAFCLWKTLWHKKSIEDV